MKPAGRDAQVAVPDGTRIAYRDHGGNRCMLVLLHGGDAAGVIEFWNTAAEQL